MLKSALILVAFQVFFTKQILGCSCGCGSSDSGGSSDFSSPDISPLPHSLSAFSSSSYEAPASRLYNNDYISSDSPFSSVRGPTCYPPPPPPIPPPSVCKELGIVPPSMFSPRPYRQYGYGGGLLSLLRKRIRTSPCLSKPSLLSQKLGLMNLRSYEQGFNLNPLQNYGCGCGR